MNAQSRKSVKARVASILGMLGVVGVAVMSPAVHAENREVRIINETDAALVEFHASNAGTSDWEEDLLGRGTVRSGGSFMADIDEGSGYWRFDFKAVFDDGRTAVKYGVDVCRIETFRFTNS